VAPDIALATRQLELREAPAQPVDPSSLAAVVEPAVVRVDVSIDYQHAVGYGTGIVLSPDGEVLTNYHVVQGANSITATNAGHTYPVDLVGYDRQHDVALLRLRDASGLPTAPIGDPSVLAIGDQVLGIGNADGTGSPATHEPGNVIQLNRTINAEDALTGSSESVTGLIEYAANVRPGDSGGPLVNGQGQVVGLVTAASVNYKLGPGGSGFAIPISQALGVAGQIRSRVPSNTVHVGVPTLLGVGVSTHRSPAGQGVLVHDVIHGGPADQAGLAAGDVITAVDDVPLDSPTALTYVLDRHYAGDVVSVSWIDRTGQQRTAKAALVAGP
jgi:S1-C subfamily serine protease